MRSICKVVAVVVVGFFDFDGSTTRFLEMVSAFRIRQPQPSPCNKHLENNFRPQHVLLSFECISMLNVWVHFVYDALIQLVLHHHYRTLFFTPEQISVQTSEKFLYIPWYDPFVSKNAKRTISILHGGQKYTLRLLMKTIFTSLWSYTLSPVFPLAQCSSRV